MREKPERDPAKMVGYTVFLSYAYADQGDYGHATAVLTEALREDAEEIDRATRSTAYRALARLYAQPGTRRSPSSTPAAASSWRRRPATSGTRHRRISCCPRAARRRPGRRGRRELVAARRAYGDRMSGMDEGFVAVEEARRSLQQGDPEGAAGLAREAIELLGNLSVPGELGETLPRARPQLRRDRPRRPARRRPTRRRSTPCGARTAGTASSAGPTAGTASSCAGGPHRGGDGGVRAGGRPRPLQPRPPRSV